MTARILDGREIGARVREAVRKDADEFTARTRIVPGLVVIIVGENPASQVYVRSKNKACLELGWFSEIRALPEDVTQQELESVIESLNSDSRVHGILLQLPLPSQARSAPGSPLTRNALVSKVGRRALKAKRCSRSCGAWRPTRSASSVAINGPCTSNPG